MIRINHERNIPLGSPLRNGRHVDTVAAQGLEDLSRNAGCSTHPVTNDGNDTLAGSLVERCERALEFVAELLSHSAAGGGKIGRAHGKTDRMFGGCL